MPYLHILIRACKDNPNWKPNSLVSWIRSSVARTPSIPSLYASRKEQVVGMFEQMSILLMLMVVWWMLAAWPS